MLGAETRRLVRRIRSPTRAAAEIAFGLKKRAIKKRQQRYIRDGRLTIGEYSYGPFRIDVYPTDPPGCRVEIGKYCAMAHDVMFMVGGAHGHDRVSIWPFRQHVGDLSVDGEGRPIVVGNDVWMGRGALILPGVRIGDGAVIGAHAVVSRDARPYAVVVGNPGREVKRRFDDATVDWLLQTKWWEEPHEALLKRINWLTSPPRRP